MSIRRRSPAKRNVPCLKCERGIGVSVSSGEGMEWTEILVKVDGASSGIYRAKSLVRKLLLSGRRAEKNVPRFENRSSLLLGDCKREMRNTF